MAGINSDQESFCDLYDAALADGGLSALAVGWHLAQAVAGMARDMLSRGELR
jgi:hypothetical protein